MFQHVIQQVALAFQHSLICYLLMNLKFVCPRIVRISFIFLVILFFQSCSNSRYRQDVSVEQRLIINPPSMVEKLWLARHHYDEERRLIVPKVGGSRWGAVQEYTADGNLVYRDWWVRNLKVEDLEAAPSMEIEVVREEDSSSRPPVLGISGIDLEQPETDNSEISNGADDSNATFPPAGSIDPFAPIPAVPNDAIIPPTGEADPFAPLPPMEEPDQNAPAEPDPFAPLPSPF